MTQLANVPTRKTGSNKHVRESTESTDEWCTRYMPIMPSNITVLVVDADIYQNANDDKNYNRSHFEGGKPIFWSRNISDDMNVTK